MKKKVSNLDEYNIKTCINKLKNLSIERLILNSQLDELIVKYIDLDKTKI